MEIILLLPEVKAAHIVIINTTTMGILLQSVLPERILGMFGTIITRYLHRIAVLFSQTMRMYI